MADFLRASSITSSTLWLSYDLTGLGEWELLRQYKRAPQVVEELGLFRWSRTLPCTPESCSSAYRRTGLEKDLSTRCTARTRHDTTHTHTQHKRTRHDTYLFREEIWS